MKLSTKGRYGLKALYFIAVQKDGEIMSVSNLSKLTQITPAYLEKILSILKKNNFVFLLCSCIILLLLAVVLALSEAQRLYYQRGLDGEKTPEEWKPAEDLKTRLLSVVLSPAFLLCIGGFAAVVIGM